jgi:hypothetical protein
MPLLCRQAKCESFSLNSGSLATVRKAKRDAGPQHEGDGKFRHPRRTIGKIRHQHRSGPKSMWMTEFSVTHMLWAVPVPLRPGGSTERDSAAHIWESVLKLWPLLFTQPCQPFPVNTSKALYIILDQFLFCYRFCEPAWESLRYQR